MSTKILQCCLKSICIYNVRRQYQRERERVCDGESGSRHTGKFEVRKRASLEISQSTCLAECCTTVPTTTTHGTAESSLTLSLSQHLKELWLGLFWTRMARLGGLVNVGLTGHSRRLLCLPSVYLVLSFRSVVLTGESHSALA